MRMSRCLRQEDTQAFLSELIERLIGQGEPELVNLIDGKPLHVSRHSQDPDAAFGRGAGGMNKGCKLHAIYGLSGRLLAWQVHPMNIDEKAVANALVEELPDDGYLLADTNHDGDPTYAAAGMYGHQMVAPRRMGTGQGLGTPPSDPATPTSHRHAGRPKRFRSRTVPAASSD